MRRAAPFVSLCHPLCPWQRGDSRGAQRRSWPTERPPQPLPATDIKFPPYEIQTLPNGLQVVAVLHHEQPAVTMRLLIRAGTASDPKEKLGLAHLTASLLDQGVKNMSAQEMNDAVDFIGGAWAPAPGTDLTFCNMVVMKDSFEVGMRMLSDMARYPAFAPAEIERQRQQMLSGLQVSAEDPGYIANAVFDRLVYGFHPVRDARERHRRRRSPASRATISSRSTQQHFAPNNAILAIVGDVTAEEAFNGGEEDLRRLGEARPAGADVHRPARSDAARDRRQQARRGADGSARRPHRHPPEPSRLTWP